MCNNANQCKIYSLTHNIVSNGQRKNQCKDVDDLTNLCLNKKGFNIGHINIQGLSTKIDQIKLMLNTSLNKIDVFGISETKFNSDHKTESFYIDDYQVPFRRDRTTNKGGGLIVYVKNGVNCTRRTDLEDENIEMLWIEIKPNKSKPFLIGSIYRHPDSRVIWKEYFDEHLEKVQLEEKEIIILGDMNRDLLNSNIYSDWSNYISSLGLVQMVKEQTRECQNSKTLIDHIYTNFAENIICVKVPKIGISDHYPIFCTRKLNFKDKTNSHQCIKYRSFKTFIVEDFINDLEHVSWDSLVSHESNTDANDLLNKWVAKFSNIIDKHVPYRIHRVTKLKQPDWLNSDILDAIKERDKHKTRNDTQNYRLLRNKVCNLIKESKKTSYERKIEEGKSDPKSIWKIFKEHGASSNTSKKGNSINQINKNGDEISDNYEMANEFNNFFVNVAANLKEPISNSDFTKVKQFVNQTVPENMYFNIPLITEEQTRKMLVNLDTSKSTGLDQIGPKLLKLSANIISTSITNVINCSLRQGIFPDIWKNAKVNPLFKSGASDNVNNYRPISILPTLSKLIEKHVHNSFIEFLNYYKLLCKSQSGFRKNHSCESALVHMIDKWLQGLNDGKLVGVIMVDFR